MKNGYKLVIIGAGSVYTPEIFNEIIKRWHRLPIREIALVDIEEGKKEAKIIEAFGRRMFGAQNIECKLSLTLDRKEALKGADFVINQLRAGRMAAREADEKLGIDLGIIGQETTGAGGFVNALRTIPIAVQIARDIEQVCPDAWLVNFANPSGIVTEAILKNSSAKCVGLCNVPVNMQSDIAKILGVQSDLVHCRFVGLNHLSFVTAAEYNGEDVLPEVLDKIGGNETIMKNIPKVPGVGELTKKLGIIPSPYLQYYYFENEMLKKQIDEWEKNKVTRSVLVSQVNNTLFEKYSDESLTAPPPELSNRGGSLYSFAALNIMEALTGEDGVELVVNTSNNGAVYGLEDDDVVETNCIVSKSGIKPLPFGKLPDSISGIVKMIKQYERLTVEAAIEHSREKALWALLNHPLIHGFNNAKSILMKAAQLHKDYIYLQ
jgi:6-phospho-beta-glucosidase